MEQGVLFDFFELQEQLVGMPLRSAAPDCLFGVRRSAAGCQVGLGRGNHYNTSLCVDEYKMSEQLQQAVTKFRYLDNRTLELQSRLARFEIEKGSEFALCILKSGDRGVWEWTGGNLGVPEE